MSKRLRLLQVFTSCSGTMRQGVVEQSVVFGPLSAGISGARASSMRIDRVTDLTTPALYYCQSAFFTVRVEPTGARQID
jgi:hypothetical protein